MKNFIIKLRKNILQFSNKFEKYTSMIWNKIRVKIKYIRKKGKIDKKYKKDIKNYWNKYININTSYHKMYSDCNGIKDVKYFYYI